MVENFKSLRLSVNAKNMEESEKKGAVSSDISEPGICNQIIITDLTLTPNRLNDDSTALSLQENTLFPFSDESKDSLKVTEIDNSKEFIRTDTTDSHIDTLRLSHSNKERIPLLAYECGLFRYAPKWVRNLCLTPYGILFFLCWASTMQVRIIFIVLGCQ